MSSRGLVLASQVTLAATLAVCLPLMPRFLFTSNMGGLSNYGVQPRTVLPFTLGLAVSSGLLLRASALLRAAGQRRLAAVTATTASLTLLDLLSTYPYQLSPAWHALHTVAAVLLGITELVGALAVADELRDPPGYAAVTVVLTAFVLMALTFFGALHILFAAEVVTGLGFGFLLVRAAGQVEARSPVSVR